MASARTSSSRPIEIHRTAPDPRPASAPQKLTFAGLLRQRRDTAVTKARTESATPDAAPDSPHALPAPEPDARQSQDEPGDSGSPGGGANAVPRPREPGVGESGDDTSWTQKLMPTSALVEDMVYGLRATTGPLSADSPHPVVLALARTVARFCNDPTVDDSEGWQVRMPLRPDVLPETTLDLSISSCWLKLRFETAHAKSRELILQHRPALVDLLESSLDRRRDIVVSLD